MRVNVLLAVIVMVTGGVKAVAAPSRYELALVPVIGSFSGQGAAVIETQDTVGQGEYTATTGLMTLSLAIGGQVFTLMDDPAARVVLDHGKIVGLSFSGQSEMGWLRCTSTRLGGAMFFFKTRVRAATGLIMGAARGKTAVAAILSLEYALLALIVAGLWLASRINRRNQAPFNSGTGVASASS